ncbi:MAG: adenylate/guanylate cyclase domain-containing protein [Bacteroidota bacterium]
MSKYLKSFLKYATIWTIAISFWSIMRQFGQELVDEPQVNDFATYAMFHISLGIIASLIFTATDVPTRIFLNRFRAFGSQVLASSIVNLIIFLVLIYSGIIVYNLFQNASTKPGDVLLFFQTGEGFLLLFYCYLVSFFTKFVEQVDRKFGPGNLIKMLLGVFQKPKEVERVFLFLDLTSSTTIAEKIGHYRYSELIQDCFLDLNIVEQFRGDIYQYVGDEAVITWDVKNALYQSNAIQFFFAFQDRLQSKRDYYLEKYEVFPEFKGGMNFGKIMMAEVGEIKREIAYHGDTINVASRIQGLCNDYKEKLLIAESFYLLIGKDDNYKMNFLDYVTLKGKEKSINVYSISRYE